MLPCASAHYLVLHSAQLLLPHVSVSLLLPALPVNSARLLRECAAGNALSDASITEWRLVLRTIVKSDQTLRCG